MNISINASRFENLPRASRDAVEEKLAPVARLLGPEGSAAILDVEIASAPPEGRSATPTRITANLACGKAVFHAEAVKPTPAAAADRVRATLEHEIRAARGKGKSVWKRGAMHLKNVFRFGD